MKQPCYTKKLVSEGLPEIPKGELSVTVYTSQGDVNFNGEYWYDSEDFPCNPRWWLSDEGEKHVLSDEEMKGERIAFANWISNEKLNGRSIEKLHRDYELYLTTKQDEQTTNG